MQLASLESTILVEPSLRQNEFPISTFAERFLFKPAPEESADAEADATPDAPAAGKTASPGTRAVRSAAAKLPPATAATPVPTPAPTKKIRTADLAQDPSLHVDATNKTAIYDISAHMVYLPSGRRLEAHSGLGDKLDDPRSANVRMRGVTPPHLYDLKPREALFHGVPALRLNPIGGEEAIYGRAGLLAHTYMLGPNGDSNGCVSFKNYEAFLRAYRNGEVKRLAVVARVD